MKFWISTALVFGSVMASATEARFSAIARDIFATSCMPCHSQTRRAGEVDLSSYNGTLSSQVLVAGRPNDSSLYTEVANGRMPLRGSRLSDDKVEAIRLWIESGAPNN